MRCIFVFQVHRIRENPVLYLLNSISKLKPEKGFVDHHIHPLSITYSPPIHLPMSYSPPLRFYPMLDVDQLYKILTTEKSLLLAHPQLAGGTNDDLDEQMVNLSSSPSFTCPY